MPQIASAKKRVKVTARQFAENSLHRTRARTALKQVRLLAASGKTKEAIALVAITYSHLDKAAKVGAFHANTVSRYKSRLSAALKAAGNKEAIPARGKSTGKKAAAKPAAKGKPKE